MLQEIEMKLCEVKDDGQEEGDLIPERTLHMYFHHHVQNAF